MRDRLQRVDCRSSTEPVERQLNAALPSFAREGRVSAAELPSIAMDRTALTGHELPVSVAAQITMKRSFRIDPIHRGQRGRHSGVTSKTAFRLADCAMLDGMEFFRESRRSPGHPGLGHLARDLLRTSQRRLDLSG